MTLEIEFKAVECPHCCVPFMVTAHFMKERRDDHQTFYCPFGHSQYYPGKSDKEKLQDRLDMMESDRNHFKREADRQRREREMVERSRIALKGQVTRANNKLKKGLCPCCDAVFPDLKKHIAEAHEDFDIEIDKSPDPKFASPQTPPKRKRGRPRKSAAKAEPNEEPK